jgi:hypothetical protein
VSRLLHFCTFDNFLKALVFLVILVAAGLTPMQGDTWWQLRAGRDMWASGRVMLTDVYSHTSYGAFWLNHEWLAEVAYYAMYRAGGLPAVTLFATALIAGGWAVTWHLARARGRLMPILVLVALLPASLWWEPRPHAFSLLFIPATVLLIATNRLLWLPPLFAFWANVHGGVLLGVVLAAAGLAARIYVEPARWQRPAWTFAGCLVAVTLTPFGISFWLEIPRSLERIHMYPYDEWKRPSILDVRLVPFWAIAVAFCAGLLRGRRALPRSPYDATIYACALSLLPMSVMAIRNVGPFLMLALPAVSLLFPVLNTSRSSGPERRVLNFGLTAAAAVIVVLTIGWAYHNRIPKLRWTPIEAAALAALENCPDNLYNRFDEGGKLLWFAPDRKVFLDGRQDPFPPELVLEHIRMEIDGSDYRPVFARHGIRCAYLPTISPTAIALVNDGWTTLHRGSRWVVLRQY